MTSLHKDIRIIIPAYNTNKTIVDCLEATLVAMSFSNSWEIIVVDNGKNSDLNELLDAYPVKIIHRKEIPSAAYARNEGAKGFNKGIMVFIDSDVICEKKSIEQLIHPIQKGMVHATIGNYSKNLEGLTFSQKYKQIYIQHVYDRNETKIKNDFWTAISSVDAEVFHKLKGFDSTFKGANGEDQEFGIRLTRNNFEVVSVPQAIGQHRNPYSVYKIIRNDFRKGITAVKNSLVNNVPFSDNRHATKADRLAVTFSALSICFVFLSLFYPILIIIAFGSFISWFLNRYKLSTIFFEKDGFLFGLKAVILMFALDLVRFICVVIGLANNI